MSNQTKEKLPSFGTIVNPSISLLHNTPNDKLLKSEKAKSLLNYPNLNFTENLRNKLSELNAANTMSDNPIEDIFNSVELNLDTNKTLNTNFVFKDVNTWNHLSLIDLDKKTLLMSGANAKHVTISILNKIIKIISAKINLEKVNNKFTLNLSTDGIKEIIDFIQKDTFNNNYSISDRLILNLHKDILHNYISNNSLWLIWYSLLFPFQQKIVIEELQAVWETKDKTKTSKSKRK